VATLMAGMKYRNAGQVCISPTRFFVQEKAYDRFVAKFTDLAKQIKVGDGLDPTTKMGPLANPRRIDAIDGFVRDAQEKGAKDAKIAAKVADTLDHGMVTINHMGLALPETPFGGVKDSGYGHEGGIEGLQVYMTAKFVSQLG